jgi:AmmeMemoRadiSam system protein B/AmmeMemoRadiSam system protein A
MRLFSQDALPEDKITYRPPTVAGSFYPADPDSLRKMIDTLLLDRKGQDVSTREIFGLIAPHAGYLYSGKVAGKAYKALIGRKYDAVIIIAPSHQLAFKGASVFSGDAYVTPLGVVNVDKKLASDIASVNTIVKLSMDGHKWKGDTPEHSIEVQLPFLQVTIPGTPVVPIVMGTQDALTQDALMRSIVYAVKNSGKKVLLLASTDLSHYHDADSAVSIDGVSLNTLYRYDYFSYQTQFIAGKFEACGGGPIVVVMTAAEQLGATSFVPVNYSHSGKTEAGKNQSKVVGYFSGLIIKARDEEVDETPFFDQSEIEKVMDIAKKTVINTVTKNNEKEYEIQLIPYNLSFPKAAFVTIHKHGSLRACMGHTFPTESLINEIKYAAKLAATSDYRFGPLRLQELDSLQYEVTVLSRMKRVLDINKIVVGKDGLLIRMGNNQGVFLPQVASEKNWDITSYLENLCYKAGLPKDAYFQPEAQLYSFRALIIKEEKK